MGIDDLDFEDVEIQKLELSKRAMNCLLRNNVFKLSELLKLSDKEIKSFKSLGENTFNEIVELKKSLNHIKSFEMDCEFKNITFIYVDGLEYFDIEVDDLGLSSRVVNFLNRNSIYYYSQMLQLQYDNSISYKNLGSDGIKEINDAIEVNKTKTKIKLLEKSENIIYDKIMQILNIKDKKIDLSGLAEFKILCKEYTLSNNINTENDIELEVISFVYKNKENASIKVFVKDYIINAINNSNFGINIEDIKTNMLFDIKDGSYIENTVAELVTEDKIYELEKLYFIKHQSIIDIIKPDLKDSYLLVFEKRLNGETLNSAGEVLNITRERARQIESKVKSIIIKVDVPYKENFYAPIFEKYKLSQDEFIAILGEDNITYNFLNMLYKQGELPFEYILEDEEIPSFIKSKIEGFVHKNFAIIKGERVTLETKSIVEYVVKVYAIEPIKFDVFLNHYTATLNYLKIDEDSNLYVSSGTLENIVKNSNFTLASNGNIIRAYNINNYDYTELFDVLDLNQYQDIEYSSFKFFTMYDEVMKNYDIRDEYELHNLLKKICPINGYTDINFARMPIIEFGTSDRDTQVLELLLATAPILNSYFAIQYEELYGVKKETVLSNYLKGVDVYLKGKEYNFDFKPLPLKLKNDLKALLTEEFYTIKKLKSIFVAEFPTEDVMLLNHFNLKNLGFSINSSYIYSNKYSYAKDYFVKLLTETEVTDSSTFPEGVREIQQYLLSLSELKCNYQIIEKSTQKYLNIRSLEAKGITIDDLNDYYNDVLSRYSEGEYFTIFNLRKNGHTHKLYSLGFDDYFYTSLITQKIKEISYCSKNDVKLIQKGSVIVRFDEFFEELFNSRGYTDIKIDKFVTLLKDEYNLYFKNYKVREIIKSSTLHYGSETQKIYKDYATYDKDVNI